MITSSHQYVWLLYESQLTITTRLSNHYQRVFIVSWLSSKEDLWQRHQCKIRLQSNGDTSFSISKNNVFFLKDKSVERGVVFLFLGVLDHLEIEKNKQKNLNIWSESETLKHCTELSFTIELFSFCYYRLLQKCILMIYLFLCLLMKFEISSLFKFPVYMNFVFLIMSFTFLTMLYETHNQEDNGLLILFDFFLWSTDLL